MCAISLCGILVLTFLGVLLYIILRNLDISIDPTTININSQGTDITFVFQNNTMIPFTINDVEFESEDIKFKVVSTSLPCYIEGRESAPVKMHIIDCFKPTELTKLLARVKVYRILSVKVPIELGST